jgi:uncharacterized protein
MHLPTQHLWIGFTGGLLAFAHCVGMCGGFALQLSQGTDRRRMIIRQLLWQAGKMTSYMFLGAVAGYAGGFLDLFFIDNRLFQNLLSGATGAVILLLGLSLLGLLPVRGRDSESVVATALSTLCRNLFTDGSPATALSMGMATAFLPCPIVLAYLAYSLQSGTVLNGMATMGALSVGTALPLLLLGGITRLSRVHLHWGPKAGGIILVLLGLSTALRGTTVCHHLLGCPAQPALQQVPPMATKACCVGKPHDNSSGN